MNEEFIDDPYACSGSTPDEPPAPDHHADAMAVHGMLALLLPGEAQRIQERVDRAISEISAQNRGSRLRFARRVAWIGSSIGIAAVIVLAILFVPDSSDSRAFAALESMRSSAREGGRVYSIRIDGVAPSEIRAATKDAPGKERPLQPERGDRPVRQVRTGDLVVGPSGMWVILMNPQPATRGSQADAETRKPRGVCAFGFDGSSYWVVEPSGATRRGSSLKELRVPLAFAALGDGLDSADEDPEVLTLGPMLDRLERGYTIKFDALTKDDQARDRPITAITARRKGAPTLMGFPAAVRVVADAQTFEVLKARWVWEWENPANADSSEGARPQRLPVRIIEFTRKPIARGGAPFIGDPSPSWFTPDGYRQVLDLDGFGK